MYTLVGSLRRAICASLVLAAAASFSPAATINGSTPYLNGANIPWNNFGMDFGTHPSWGAGYDPTWWNNTFAALAAYKINAARIWVHCDGRASPEFNSSGDVTGLDSNFIPNLQDMLDKAHAHGVRVQLCLWSFDMCNDNTGSAGPYAGRHHTLITNTTYRNNYITRALNPMLDGIVNKPALAIIEVINEPEWAITEAGGHTTYKVSRDQMRAFVRAVRDAVKAKTSKHVTVGSASVKWSTNNGRDGTDSDYWGGLGLDHREVHYYDWMVGSGYNFDPFANGHTPAYYGWTTPAVIGEFGGNGNTPYSAVLDMMNRAYNNGYAGHMPWSYWGGDAEGSFADFRSAALTFANNHDLGGGGGGNFIRLRNRGTNLYVDGMGRTANGSNLGQYANTNSQNAHWVEEWSGGYVRFRNRATGLYLDGMGATANGSVCGQWSSSGSQNQQWIQETVSGGYYRFRNRASGLYLDGMGRTANGSDVGQWSNSGSYNQQFSKVSP
jgi:hypothetical protein